MIWGYSHFRKPPNIGSHDILTHVHTTFVCKGHLHSANRRKISTPDQHERACSRVRMARIPMRLANPDCGYQWRVVGKPIYKTYEWEIVQLFMFDDH